MIWFGTLFYREMVMVPILAADIVPNTCFDSCELLAKARRMAAFSSTAANSGNTIVVFSMLVLQKILEVEAANPQDNLTRIIEISNSIANLNNSLKILP